MNTRTARLSVRCLAAALALAASLGAQAQQGFDQTPNYPSQPAQPNAWPQPNQPTAPGYPPASGMAGQPQPAYPVQPAYPAQPGVPAQPDVPLPAPPPNGNPLQALAQMELQDYGTPPQSQLQTQLHGPTPTSIPGGQTITTDRLMALYQQGQQNGLLVFDVLGSGTTLPMAQNAVGAAQPGNFQDQTQQQFGQFLQQVTQGNTGRPMVFYCQGTQCWMSYNAALRAINLGYKQVYWYRGGTEAWQYAQQLAGSMQNGQPANGGYQNAGYPPAQAPGQSGWR